MTQIDDIVAVFELHRNHAQAVQMAAYMKNNFEFIGIKKPLRAELSKPYLKNKITEKNDLINLVNALWEKGEREYQYVAIEFLYRNRRLLDLDCIPILEQLIVDKSWWDTVDALAARIIGFLLSAFPDDMESAIRPWIASENMWLNRTAIIFQLKYKSDTRLDLLTAAIEAHAHSKEFFLAKAIGWALRQYSKTDPKWVRAFLATHQLQPLSVREANKYLD